MRCGTRSCEYEVRSAQCCSKLANRSVAASRPPLLRAREGSDQAESGAAAATGREVRLQLARQWRLQVRALLPHSVTVRRAQPGHWGIADR